MKIFLSLMFSLLLFSQAYGQSSGIKPQTQGGISFVSGGVGEEEHKALRAIQGQYNLHLTFAVKGSGEFAAGVKVSIADAKGNALLNTTAEGPNLFVKLKPGHYKVAADRDGHVITETVSVPEKHGTTVVFHFPTEKGD